jgi:aspartyl-tRNA synthetase
VNEELRLQYRYLDLRRPRNGAQPEIAQQGGHRHAQFMDEQGFLEVETPTLFKSTPEGAREFLVPNRREPGTFYALPQSPQQFKQILMVAGVEKYFQLARCYRDEDLRADRQPEFTQVDIEMSFIEREDIYALIEGLLKRVWKTALNMDIPTPFKRITFEEALNRYGIDKPDTRFGMELVDFTEEFKREHVQGFQRRDCQWRRGEGAQRQGPGRRDAGPDRDDDRIRQEFRRERPGVHQGGKRRMEIAHREIFQRRGKAALTQN